MCRWKQIILGALLSIVMVWFLIDPVTVRTAASDGLSLCAGSVIPALFPFLTVSGLIMALGFGEWLSRPLGGVMETLYHVDGAGSAALVLGLLGGYPVGAKTAADLYQSGALTKDEAEHLLIFVNNASPAAFISALGAGIFHNVRTGAWLWLIHVLTALLTGLLLRGRRTAEPSYRRKRVPIQTVRFSSAFVSSVRSAASAMVNICAFVTLFHILTRPLTRLPEPLSLIAAGLMEQFSAFPMVPNNAAGFILISGLSGWGGLSVHCQTMAALSDSGLSIRACLLGKAVQGLLSLIIAAGVTKLIY